MVSSSMRSSTTTCPSSRKLCNWSWSSVASVNYGNGISTIGGQINITASAGSWKQLKGRKPLEIRQANCAELPSTSGEGQPGKATGVRFRSSDSRCRFPAGSSLPGSVTCRTLPAAGLPRLVRKVLQQFHHPKTAGKLSVVPRSRQHLLPACQASKHPPRRIVSVFRSPGHFVRPSSARKRIWLCSSALVSGVVAFFGPICLDRSSVPAHPILGPFVQVDARVAHFLGDSDIR